jgi:hypothetical protein
MLRSRIRIGGREADAGNPSCKTAAIRAFSLQKGSIREAQPPPYIGGDFIFPHMCKIVVFSFL